MIDITLQDIVQFAYIFVFVFLGVFTKDYFNTITGKEVKIYALRILLISIAISLFMLGIQFLLMRFLNDALFLFVCVGAGWVNYKFYGILTATGEMAIKIGEDTIKKEGE